MKLLFVDLEVSSHEQILEIGAVNEHGELIYRGKDVNTLMMYCEKYDAIVGHNFIDHDIKYLLAHPHVSMSFHKKPIIDSLRLSSLIFIKHPYHKLIKDYKLDKINNPTEDARLCKAVFDDAVNEFTNLDTNTRNLFSSLLHTQREFQHFFSYLEEKGVPLEIVDPFESISNLLKGHILDSYFEDILPASLQYYPLEIAYMMRLLSVRLCFDRDISILPSWFLYRSPHIHTVIGELIAHKIYSPKQELKKIFGYDHFRDFPTEDGGVVSQEAVILNTLKGRDLLAIFATGGGKSLTFQLPALMSCELTGCLTIVISPLQSLMKDQVDVLNQRFHIHNVGFINASLNPIERRDTEQKVKFGGIDLLYISPELLRSPSTKTLLQSRYVDRIVIDEAHCLSKWGHDFRTDYMFIAPFIKDMRETNKSFQDVKISCFTATAKESVKTEIITYFGGELGRELKLYRATHERDNLSYRVLHVENTTRFETLIDLLEDEVKENSCIIFTQFTGEKTDEGAKTLSQKINEHFGYALSSYYHGALDPSQKRVIQEDFILGNIKVMVATNAFGMGVDKENVRYIIHYNIPGSIENYLQEAGRAGRDGLPAECIILYHPEDMDEVLEMIRSGQVGFKECKMLQDSLKERFKNNPNKPIIKSTKELVKLSCWIQRHHFEKQYFLQKTAYQTKIQTALYFLEKHKFIERKFNTTRIWATANNKISLAEACEQLDHKTELIPEEVSTIKEIYKAIKNSQALSIEDLPYLVGRHFQSNESEAKKGVVELVSILKDDRYIEQEDEISIILNPIKETTSIKKLQELENVFWGFYHLIPINLDRGGEYCFVFQDINTKIAKQLKCHTVADELQDLLHFLQSEKFIKRRFDTLSLYREKSEIHKLGTFLFQASEKILSALLLERSEAQRTQSNIILKKTIDEVKSFVNDSLKTLHIEKVLKFLHKTEIIKVESGLFLFHRRYQIFEGINWDKRYTKAQYEIIAEYYEQKIIQAKILSDLAQRWQNHQSSEEFLNDYFQLEMSAFMEKYFKYRIKEMKNHLSTQKLDKIHSGLSKSQAEVIECKNSLLISAGPGAGKTKTLIHKVLSLIWEDSVSTEQFLLLTYSRTAKYDLKRRLIKYMGARAKALEINTFHGYAYKLLQKQVQSQDYESPNGIIEDAIDYLTHHCPDPLPYSILILDEFQDINDAQFELVKCILKKSSASEKMQIIAAGDDDQNIYEFQGGNVKHFHRFVSEFEATEFILEENYRSTQALIDFSSRFISTTNHRGKNKTKFISKHANENTLFQGSSHIEAIECHFQHFESIFENLLKLIDPSQETVILCHNNESCLVLHSLFTSKNIPSEILLSSDINFFSTFECQKFLEKLSNEEKITSEMLSEGGESIKREYGENSNTKILEKSFKELVLLYSNFSHETLTQFYYGYPLDELPPGSTKLTLSTLHKAKGREFERVILIFDPQKSWDSHYNTLKQIKTFKSDQDGNLEKLQYLFENKSPEIKKRFEILYETKTELNELLQEMENYIREKIDAEKRLLYVGMTRAKTDFVCIGNSKHNPYFQFLSLHAPLKNQWKLPIHALSKTTLTVHTTHKDIFLSYHAQINTLPLFDLGTSVKLVFTETKVEFHSQGVCIQVSSKSFLQKINNSYLKKGYHIIEAKVYQRLWFTPQNEKPCIVYLFSITLEKK